MATRKVAEARRTQLVSTYGIGSLFPAQDESFMILGLDDWSEKVCPEVSEPRLARSMGVATFRMPPARSAGRDVPVVRFPRLHHCPKCGRLDELSSFCGWDDHSCLACQRSLTPSRFVICCPQGHIDDFPYFSWVHAGHELPTDQAHGLSLRSRGQSSSLADIVVECSCGVPSRTMAGAFGAQAMVGVSRCRGLRPWLRGSTVDRCDSVPRTLQRGSSNVWFAAVRSALSIPPWSEGVQKLVGRHWPVISVVPAAALEATLGALPDVKDSGLQISDLVRTILEMRGDIEGKATTDTDLREEEYQALVAGRPERDPRQQFVCEPVERLEPDCAVLFRSVSDVARLREVRALAGFTRVTPASDLDPGRLAPLSTTTSTWLPAIEVLGEGVFLRFHEEVVANWERSDFARARTTAVNDAMEIRARQYDLGRPVRITPRRLLLHSFAHVLLTELGLDAGYPVASLRERVYAGPEQAGVLIYTASSDSAGSLGGLSAQSDPQRIWAVVRSAIKRARWCSSDPVCIESTGGGVDALNLAACHACLLLPETSCEHMNQMLDRACLVGLPTEPDQGFFTSFIA